jgi:hypothetical protein
MVMDLERNGGSHEIIGNKKYIDVTNQEIWDISITCNHIHTISKT